MLTFSTVEEAVAGIQAIDKDYLQHCRAARHFAEEKYLDSKIVLGNILNKVGIWV